MSGRLAVFCSGQGTILRSVGEAVRSGRLPVELALVVADRPCPGAEWARAKGLPLLLVDRAQLSWREREALIATALSQRDISHLLLAGYLSRLGPELAGRYQGRALNVHPSLLPAFPGLDAIGQALSYGVRITGVTVHLVDEQIDGGPIVWQEAVAVLPDDDWASLRQRLAPVEQRGVLVALQGMVAGRLEVSGRRVRIGNEKGAP